MTSRDPSDVPHPAALADPAELLRWYQLTGVDAGVGSVPINWLERGSTTPGADYVWPTRDDQTTERDPNMKHGATATSPAVNRATIQAPSTSSPSAPSTTTERSAALGLSVGPQSSALKSRPSTPLAANSADPEARRIAAAAPTLAAIESALRSFDGCSLKATATNLCFYRGSPTARVMVIGEAPGREEDIEGRPFVGPAGQLLDKMLTAIGLTESDVHITNVVYWRPPGNRAPTAQETAACRPFLERQMELVNPAIVIAFGGPAASAVLGISDAIMRSRGTWRTLPIAGRDVAAMATLHPAYLLRTPAAKQLAWADLLKIKAKLREI